MGRALSGHRQVPLPLRAHRQALADLAERKESLPPSSSRKQTVQPGSCALPETSLVAGQGPCTEGEPTMPGESRALCPKEGPLAANPPGSTLGGLNPRHAGLPSHSHHALPNASTNRVKAKELVHFGGKSEGRAVPSENFLATWLTTTSV